MAKSAAPTTDDRLTALEDAVRVMATTLYAPNGGGDAHVAEAQALFASVVPAPAPEVEPETPAETPAEPAADASAEASAAS